MTWTLKDLFRASKATSMSPDAEADAVATSVQAIDPQSSDDLPPTGTVETQNPIVKERSMPTTDLTGLNDISGFIGACLVDTETGLMMASEGGDGFDLETAGAANCDVLKAKMNAKDLLGFQDENIEDILITLNSQFHLIRPLESNPNIVLYTAIDKSAANLGMAWMQVKKVEKALAI